MSIQIFHSLWGMKGTLKERLERAKFNGYQGIESSLPDPANQNEFLELMEELQLQYIAQIYTSGNHEESFQQQVERSKLFSPILINSHSGKDFMTENEQNQFFEFALRIEKLVGIPVGHETHRGRIMFTPDATSRVLRLFPGLKVTADFSHFTCVCGSMLHDQEDNLAIIMSRAIHIHGRVGYEHGPQVPHPAAPEYKEHLARFEQWWEKILSNRNSDTYRISTFTPEFGPPGYMPRLPFTNQDVADLFEINHWIAERMRVKYGG